jgi:hypothetical protein
MSGDRVWTWDKGDVLVGWNYRPMRRSDGGLVRLDLEAPEARRAWLRGLLARLPALLGDFACPAKSNVAGLEINEDTHWFDWRSKEGPAELLDLVGKADGVVHVETGLTLTCLDRNLDPFEIERGGDIWVSFMLTEPGALNTAYFEDPVYLRVTLRADPYAPITRAPVDDKDNRVLAAINGPRLTAFLERIERDVPAQLIEVDEEVYRGAVGPRGFLPVPGTLAGA